MVLAAPRLFDVKTEDRRRDKCNQTGGGNM